MEINVPTISCEVCIQTLSKGILNSDPNAKVEGNPDSKTLQIESNLSQAEIQGIITKLGHEYS